MKAFKCDICGRHYDEAQRFGNETEGVVIYEDGVVRDLCPKCYRRIYEMLHKPKRTVRPEIETPELNGGFVFR